MTSSTAWNGKTLSTLTTRKHLESSSYRLVYIAYVDYPQHFQHILQLNVAIFLVNSIVSVKAGHLRKVLSTLITSIGFFSSVNSLVSFQIWDVREVFSTLFTAVAFSSSFLIRLWLDREAWLMMQHWIGNKQKGKIIAM